MTTTPTENESPALSTIEAEDRFQAVQAAGDALRGLPAEAGDVVLTAHYILTGEHPAIFVPATPTEPTGEQILDGGDPGTV